MQDTNTYHFNFQNYSYGLKKKGSFWDNGLHMKNIAYISGFELFRRTSAACCCPLFPYGTGSAPATLVEVESRWPWITTHVLQKDKPRSLVQYKFPATD